MLFAGVVPTIKAYGQQDGTCEMSGFDSWLQKSFPGVDTLLVFLSHPFNKNMLRLRVLKGGLESARKKSSEGLLSH